MSCSWCGYSLNLVYPNFSGYIVFDSYGYNLGYNMCSMNCCVAQIYKLGTQVRPRLEYLYGYYNVPGEVKPSPNKNLLSVNGGSLSYTQYRHNFDCPIPESEGDDFNESFEDYEFEEDPYRY